MHQDMDGKASALENADYNRDWKIIEELGANFLRLAHYPHNDRAFQLCDSLGIIVQTEIPWVNVCGTSARMSYFNNIQNQLKEMIVNYMNHPSIVFWGLWNELDTWGNNDLLQGALDPERVSYETAKLYDFAKKLDAEFRLPVYDLQYAGHEKAQFTFVNHTEAPLPVIVAMQERGSGRDFGSREMLLPPGESEIYYDLREMPNGEYLTRVIDNAEPQALRHGMLERLLRLRTSPPCAATPWKEVTGQKIFFPDGFDRRHAPEQPEPVQRAEKHQQKEHACV